MTDLQLRVTSRLVTIAPDDAPAASIRVTSHVNNVLTERSDGVTIRATSQGTQGQRGPVGPTGPKGTDGEFLGTAWWYGTGAPDVVVGSKAGDYYMNTLTGTIYELT